jgi:hypothetical protein
MAQTIMDRVLSGAADSNVRFSDLCALLHRLQFSARVKGSHDIFTKAGIIEILNLHPAVPWQSLIRLNRSAT